jgi:transcriptional regulator
VYIPSAFRESRPEVLHAFIQRHSFGTLVSRVEGEPFATHLPFLLDADRGPHGTLQAHMARANPHWRRLEEDAEVLVLFQGPHAYVSPAWYATPVAVPTWNYAAVHAYGRARVVDEPAVLRALVDGTVRAYEGAYEAPWSTERLDGAFVEKLLENIVGFEVPIHRLEGKLKFSQNRSPADREGVIAALLRQGDAQSVEVAELMRELERRA